MSDADRVQEARDLQGLAAEMAKQASLGHKYFCVGVHEDGETEWIAWYDAFARLRAEHAAEIAALKADGERLDWLEAFVRAHDEQDIPLAHCWDDTDDQGAAQMKFVVVNNYEIADFGKGKTLRDAIDAARASETRGRE